MKPTPPQSEQQAKKDRLLLLREIFKEMNARRIEREIEEIPEEIDEQLEEDND